MDPRGRPSRCSRRQPRRRAGPLAAALALSAALLAPPALAEEQLLAVVLNGYDTGAVLLVEEEGGRLLAPVHELSDLRIRTEGLPREDRAGRPYAVLSGAPGITTAIDRAGQRLLLTLDDGVRSRQTIGAPGGTLGGGAAPSRQVLSAFVDYDVVTEAYRGRRSTGALVDAGVSDEWGVLATSALYRSGARMVRLDTAFVHDDPDGPTRYLVGDGIARPATWGRPARFGGIQIAREFGLQPSALRYAGPVLQGQAELPSTVEVYVDNVLRYRTKVEPGPFALEGVPFMTGSGEARVIVRDPLGRETAVAAPFQVSPRVLPDGASDFAVHAGVLRQAYARSSFSYREPFAAGFYRRGTGSGTTVEAAAELARGWRTAGASVAAAVPYLGAAEVSGAVSTGRRGRGWLVAGAYQVSRGGFTLGVNAERSSKAFTQLGRSTGNPLVQRLSATASLSLGERLGTLSLTHASLRFADNERSSVAALTYGVPLWDGAYLAATGLRDLRGGDTTVAVFLTVPLGTNLTAGAEVQRRPAGLSTAASVQQRPADGRGFGYAARAEAGAGSRQQASLTWDGQRAAAALDAERSRSGTAARLSAAGSLVMADGALFAARKSQSGRALVRIPGRKGLTIYAQNRPAGTLDSDGTALIPDLLPYQENRISISMDQLPLTARLENDMTAAVPRYRGTALVEFDVRDGGGAFVQVRMPDGRPLPAGTRLSSQGPDEALVAGEDGRVFVPGARAGTRLTATVDGAPCTLTLGAVAEPDTMPDLGPQACAP